MRLREAWIRFGAVALVVVMTAATGMMAMSSHGAAKASNFNGKTSGQSAEGAVPYVIEYYYKTKWGHAEEFLALFKKNHLPVLRKEMEMGRILRVSMTAPQYHTTEEGRWDYRVTIVFKSAAIANDNFDSSTIAKQLYPDQETFRKEEHGRFEILEAHWDLPVKEVDLTSH